MKKHSILLGLAFLISAVMPNHLFSQGGLTQTQTVSMAVTGSALIRVMKGASDASTGVTLTLGGPAEAGLEVVPTATDASTRLRISSLAQGTTVQEGRMITAVLTSGSMNLSRTKLELQLATPTNTGNFINYSPDGGTLTGFQNLGDNTGNKPAVTLVTGIYTCWSGTAADDGYVIDYKYAVDGLGTPTARNVTVTYTIALQP